MSDATTKLKIVSGGQTGVDRLALDIALELGIDHGGWCPQGRISEDGPIPPRYNLQETSTRNYNVRTEMNIFESDGTLILFEGTPSGGTALTIRLAQKLIKPFFTVDFAKMNPAGFELLVDETLDWISHYQISVLNVAGPRKSNAPELPARIRPFLEKLFTTVRV